jgi:rSAM/selenodomain-associated transferase 2
MSRPPLSIVIPTFNAMPRLADCLTALVEGLGNGLVREAIIVDGASTDESGNLALDMGCRVIAVSPEARGRGQQLQAGAQAASGDWFLFLHADTVLLGDWVSVVGEHLSKSPETAAFFQLEFDKAGSGPQRVATMANWRAKVLGLPYGDQGLLISRQLYDEVGGYRAIALMEDVDIVRRLGRARLTPLRAIAQTSGAKFEQGGWWSIPARNLMLLVGYLLGVSPTTLRKLYK